MAGTFYHNLSRAGRAEFRGHALAEALDRYAAGAVRVIPPCMAMGEAAGTAAALSAKAGTTPKRLDTGDLLAALKRQKVFLG